jgi:cyclopropane-fatty-acyl-phospholipid synthase
MSAVEEDLEGAGQAARNASPSAFRAATPEHPPLLPVAANRGPSTVEGRALKRLLEMIGSPAIEFILWTGESVVPSDLTSVMARVKVADRATLYRVVRSPELELGDGYSDGRLVVEGDLVAVCEEVYRAAWSGRATPSLTHKFMAWLNKPRTNTLSGSRENIHHHYDLGNPFYQLWLGKTMQYTCAYYPTPSATLDEAQIAKMHHVCRKMQLRSGETVAEAGFGWGALALHMAKHYGVKVRAFNISHEQVVFARERAKAEGLDSRIEYVEDDYRNISGKYDAFVSVGMLEHVGVENYPQLGAVARRSIGSNGRGLIHTIGRNRPARLHPWIEKRIFPGAYPPTLSEMGHIFEPNDLSILDVENIRLHYAQTLRHWLELYEANVDRVKNMFDEKFVRMWRLYLAGSIAGFTTGTLQLFQVVFAPRENNSIPMTREHLYQS